MSYKVVPYVVVAYIVLTCTVIACAGMAWQVENELAEYRKQHAVQEETRYLFLATFRRTPTANAECRIESEGGVGKVSVRRVFRYPQIGMGPRRSPSACVERKKRVV